MSDPTNTEKLLDELVTQVRNLREDLAAIREVIAESGVDRDDVEQIRQDLAHIKANV